MSSKAEAALVAKLVGMGYSKSKATKAVKDCRGNEQQAIRLLAQTAGPSQHQQPTTTATATDRGATLLPSAEAPEQAEREPPSKGKSLWVTATEGRRGKDAAEKKHPCIVKYGHCRYGKHCAFRDLPGNLCLNYLLGTCVFGELCRDYHTIDGKDVRGLMDLKHDKEYVQLESGEVIELSRIGKVQSAEIIGVVEKDPQQPQAVPEPSAWNGWSTAQPSYSDPVHGNRGQLPVAGAAEGAVPAPFLAKLKANLPEKKPEPAAPAPGPTAAPNAPRQSKVKKVSSINELKPTAASPLLQSAMSKVLGLEQQQAPPPDAASRFHPCLVQRGNCKYGDGCRHARVPGDVCVHWLNGCCAYGDDCRWKHSKPAAGQGAQEAEQDRRVPAQSSTSPERGSFWSMNPDRIAEYQQRSPKPLRGSAVVIPGANLELDTLEDAEAEERAYVAMRAVFPDVPSTTLLHCLRLANYDRHAVADFILQKASENLDPVEMERRFLAQALGEPIDLNPFHRVEDPRKEEAPEEQILSNSFHVEAQAADEAVLDSMARTMKLVTLCELLPALDPSSIEGLLARTGYDFEESVRILETSAEHRLLSDPHNAWNVHRQPQALTMAERLTVETLEKMFSEVHPDVTRHCFIENNRDMNRAVEALTLLTGDIQELGARRSGARAAMRLTVPPGGQHLSQPALLRQASSQSEAAPTAPPAARPSPTTQLKKESAEPEAEPLGYRDVAESLDAHADWRRVREEAYLTSTARLQLLRLAADAYSRGDGKKAKEFSQRAHEYAEHYRELNLLAMRALEMEQSKNPVSTLDLHGFHVDEALEVLARRVQLCLLRKVDRLRVIVGEGKHSRGGKGVVFPALMEALQTPKTKLNRCCRVVKVRPALLHLRLALHEVW